MSRAKTLRKRSKVLVFQMKIFIEINSFSRIYPTPFFTNYTYSCRAYNEDDEDYELYKRHSRAYDHFLEVFMAFELPQLHTHDSQLVLTMLQNVLNTKYKGKEPSFEELNNLVYEINEAHFQQYKNKLKLFWLGFFDNGSTIPKQDKDIVNYIVKSGLNPY